MFVERRRAFYVSPSLPVLRVAIGEPLPGRAARLDFFGTGVGRCSMVGTRPAFFQQFDKVSLDPQLDYVFSDSVQSSPYATYFTSISGNRKDPRLSAARGRALSAALDDSDYSSLNSWFEELKSERYGNLESEVRHYALINVAAMEIGQILFVNNCLLEGLARRILDWDQVLERYRASIEGRDDEAPPTDTLFYATLFGLQSAFDKLFVPDVQLGSYEPGSGHYRLSSRYRRWTQYLDLSAIREVEAGLPERLLCENVTSGWSLGIGRAAWDELNRRYYSGENALTGQPNFFASHYDDLLERMLPQFALGKVRLAETILRDRRNSDPLRVLEFGAGSGAFAIDLQMACRRLGVSNGEIEYVGLEPSTYMVGNLGQNLRKKTGLADIPSGFSLREGSLETATDDIEGLVSRTGRTDNIGVLCFSIHHIYQPSVRAFLESRRVHNSLSRIYVLDGTERHGWTKMYYMWVDCESPENFGNVTLSGRWQSETLWEEPSRPLQILEADVTNAWCRARRLT